MRRAIEAHLSSRQVSRVIYGATIGLALIVGLQDHPPSAGVMGGTLAATAVAVALAELYSDIVGSETRSRRLGLERGELRRISGGAAAVALGIVFPAIYFVLAAAGAVGVHTAFELAKWSGLGLLAFYGFCAARLAGANLLASLVHASAVGAIGGILIGVKALLH